MRRRVMTLVAAVLLGACADAGLRREVATLRTRVDELEKQRDADASAATRLAKVEEFLGPYMNQPPAPPDPDPEVTYSVPVTGNPVVGPADAPVTIVFAYDYMCPYCTKFRDTLNELRQRYGMSVRIVYKPFIVHPKTATLPAHAACAAAQQGKFAEMDELLWTRGFVKGGYSRTLVLALADELRLDRRRFEADLDGQTCARLIADDAKLLTALLLTGTPGSWINGRFIGGALSADMVQPLIDEELARAKERIAAGTPAADYYQKFVIEGGQVGQ